MVISRTIGIDQRAESIEEPPVTVQLFLVLFFQTKQNLDWAGTGRNLAGICHDDICGVSGDVSSIDDNMAPRRAPTRKCVPSRLCLPQSSWQSLLGNNPSGPAVSEMEVDEGVRLLYQCKDL